MAIFHYINKKEGEKKVETSLISKNESNFALLIFSCDKFSDLWEAHITLLNKYWPNRKCKTYIVTDKVSTLVFDGIEIIACGDDSEMSDRVKYICNIIKEEYILLTLDDYFPYGNFEEEKFINLINFLKENNGDYLRLFKEPKQEKRIKITDSIYQISKLHRYSINLYPGLWKKEFLSSTVDESLNAWEYEVSLSKKANELKGNAFVYPKYKEVFPFMDVVRKGKILRKAWKKLKKLDIYHGNRPIRTRKEEFKLGVQTFFSKITPAFLARFIKRILKKLFKSKFYSD